jgi:hypothetical protein
VHDTTTAELCRASGTLTGTTGTLLAKWLLTTARYLGPTFGLMCSCTPCRHLVADCCVEQVLFDFCTKDGIGEINLTHLLFVSVVYIYLGHPILLRHLDLDMDTGGEVELQ